MLHDQIGFLPTEDSWTVCDYQVRSVSDRKDIAEFTACSLEGYCHPPSGAKMMKAPTTHLVSRCDGRHLHHAFREEEGALLIHTLGFLYGVRCQYSEWWHDSPVPVLAKTIAISSRAELEEAATRIVREALSWGPEIRQRFVGAMYLKRRCGAWQWAWERFAWEYIAFEALYKCGVDLGLVDHRVPHREKFAEVMKKGLVYSDDASQSEVDLFRAFRNPLLHEGQWLFDLPVSDSGMELAGELSRFTDRLVMSIASVSCRYVHSPWMSLSPAQLGLDP